MPYLRELLSFGFALTLISGLPVTVEAQSLSFLRMLAAGPPPWNSTTVSGAESGIYIAEGDNVVHKYDRDGTETWSLRFENLRLIRAVAAHGTGVYIGGATYNNVVPGPPGTSAAESFIRL